MSTQPPGSEQESPSPSTFSVAPSMPPASTGDTTTSEVDAPELDPLAAAVEKAAHLNDKYLRLAADYDNFRKRARRDVEEAESRSRETILRELLPVFDNLERALQVADQTTDVKALAEGVSMVLRQFTDTLSRISIQKVASVGAVFDPAVHEAIQQIETRDTPPGVVVAEIQAGYKAGDRLLRAALVVVAKAPSENN